MEQSAAGSRSPEKAFDGTERSIRCSQRPDTESWFELVQSNWTVILFSFKIHLMSNVQPNFSLRLQVIFQQMFVHLYFSHSYMAK
jgi:hypothetical protein